MMQAITKTSYLVCIELFITYSNVTSLRFTKFTSCRNHELHSGCRSITETCYAFNTNLTPVFKLFLCDDLVFYIKVYGKHDIFFLY